MSTERLVETASCTVGPFLHVALPWPEGGRVPGAGAGGRGALVIRILDHAGGVVVDALVKTWQADADGRFSAGFSRTVADPDG